MEVQPCPEMNQSLDGLIEGDGANLRYTIEGNKVTQLVLWDPQMIAELDLKPLLPENWELEVRSRPRMGSCTPAESIDEMRRPNLDVEGKRLVISDFSRIQDEQIRRILPEEVLWDILMARALEAHNYTPLMFNDKIMTEIRERVQERREDIIGALGNVRESAKEVAERPFVFE